MERLQGTYEVGGFLFETEEEAEWAKRELEGVRFIRQKTDLKNPETVFQVYQNLIRQDLFETPIGYCFLKELREYLLMVPAVRNEDVAAITVHLPKEEKKRKKKERSSKETTESVEEKNQKKERKEKNRDYKTRCHFFMITTLILAVSVATMMFLAATSDNIHILNYENKLIDKYSAWEQELEEREQQLKELEAQ